MRTAWGLLAVAARCSGFSLVHNQRSATETLGRQVGRITTAMSSSSSLDPASGETTFAYAYCHGFLSGPTSIKGQALRKSLLEKGVDLSLLNLNGEDNDPGGITCSGALDAVRAYHLNRKSAAGNPDLKLRLVGSSLGGYIAARYANLYPGDVDRIFMLCPSFGLGARANKFGSEAEMAEWERTGTRVFSMSTGGEASVPWAFVQEAKLLVDYPAYRCPAAIVHGLVDDVVPSMMTRSLVEGSGDLAQRTWATFVDDGHALTQPSTMAVIVETLADFFDLEGKGAEDGTARTMAGREALAKKRDQRFSLRNIEVEAKFSAHGVQRLKEAILARGGRLIGEQVFTDVYWDTKECGLTERDWWLRSRGGRWELKVPAADEGEGITAYREVTVASEIARELTEGGLLGESEANLLHMSHLNGNVLDGAGFQPFASFRTNREKFRLEGFAVDIDRASFGHEVVEIETMSTSREADISSARDSITAMAQSLGVQPAGESGRPVRGKLMEYIIRNCPRQLEVLTRRRARKINVK